MRDHAVSGAERVLHRAPWVVLRRRLDVPDISGVAAELTRLDSRSNGISVADGTTRGVYEPGSLLEVRKELGVDEAFRTLVQRAVDSDNVALFRVKAIKIFELWFFKEKPT